MNPEEKKEMKMELNLLENVFTRMGNLNSSSKEEVKLALKDSINFFLSTTRIKKEPVIKDKFIEIFESLKEELKENPEDSPDDLEEKNFFKDLDLDYYINLLRNSE